MCDVGRKQLYVKSDIAKMGIEDTDINITAIQQDVPSDENGNLKSVSDDDALLLSIGKEPELKRFVAEDENCDRNS